MEFIQYRDLERDNLEAFHQSHVLSDMKIQKQVALEVLAMLKSRVDEEDSDLCKLLACVVAPRCCLKIDVAKPPHAKK